MKKIKNSIFLKELERRMKVKEIRFNYDLDFEELEEYLEKHERKN